MAGAQAGVAIAAVGVGGVLLWSALKNEALTTVLRDVLQGKAPPSEGPDALGSASSPAGTNNPSVPAEPATVSGNVAIGKILAAGYGWATGDNWDFLYTGWREESGWSTTAANEPDDPYNHAYGIPQANPGTKMASAGADWKTSATTQIKWGLGYIRAEYGSPSQVPGWSADGPTTGYQGY